jgi:hypothetical protein
MDRAARRHFVFVHFTTPISFFKFLFPTRPLTPANHR